MRYRYFENANYEDLASGRVIYHRTGYPNFPVRLAGETYMNCLEIIGRLNGKAVLYDPCCGNGYLLAVLGFLCGDRIDSIYASDISEDAVALARENLNLLTIQGLNRRRAQLQKIYGEFGKISHSDALISAGRLSRLIESRRAPVSCKVFSADALDEGALTAMRFKADIVFTDVPYGNLASWSKGAAAIDRLLTAIIPVLSDNSVVAISSDKSQKIGNSQFARVRKILIGKRKIELLRKRNV